MYRELVTGNLEKARVAEKKGSPKAAIIVLIAGGLLGVNAFGLFVFGRGITLRGFGTTFGGIVSALLCVGAIVLGVYFIASGLKNRSASVSDKRLEAYLDAVRAIGPEDEVFRRIEGITPYAFGNGELRFDDVLIAGTSAENPDGTFIYPMSALVEAGVTALGNTTSLYLHTVTGGKKHKHSFNTNRAAAEQIVAELKAIRPQIATHSLEKKA